MRKGYQKKVTGPEIPHFGRSEGGSVNLSDLNKPQEGYKVKNQSTKPQASEGSPSPDEIKKHVEKTGLSPEQSRRALLGNFIDQKIKEVKKQDHKKKKQQKK